MAPEQPLLPALFWVCNNLAPCSTVNPEGCDLNTCQGREMFRVFFSTCVPIELTYKWVHWLATVSGNIRGWGRGLATYLHKPRLGNIQSLSLHINGSLLRLASGVASLFLYPHHCVGGWLQEATELASCCEIPPPLHWSDKQRNFRSD